MSKALRSIGVVYVFLAFSIFSAQAQSLKNFKPSAFSLFASFDEQDLFINSAFSWSHPKNFESQVSFGLGFRRTFFSGLPLPKMDVRFIYNWSASEQLTLQPFVRYYFSSIALNYYGGRRTYYHGFSPGIQFLIGSKNQVLLGMSAGPSEYWEHHLPANKGRFLGYNLMLGYRFNLKEKDD